MNIERKPFHVFTPGEDPETVLMYGLGWMVDLPSGSYVKLPADRFTTWCLIQNKEITPVLLGDVPKSLRALALIRNL